MITHDARQTVLHYCSARPSEDIANEKNAHKFSRNLMLTRTMRGFGRGFSGRE
jgi:hypothetical protein